MKPRDVPAWLARRIHLPAPLLCVALFALGLFTVPHWWCGRGADAWFDGDPSRQAALSRSVEDWVRSDLGTQDFSTGSSEFNGEWLFGTYFAAGMGFGQMALEHPESRARCVELMRLCIKRMLSPELRAFDADAWDEDAIESLYDGTGHAAYLGYLNLLLSLNNLVDPEHGYAGLNGEVTDALTARALDEPDVPAGDLPERDLSGRQLRRHRRHRPLRPRHRRRPFGASASSGRRPSASYCVDPDTGLLYQAVGAYTGEPLDAPRGSGTCLGLYMLSFMDRDLSRDLYDGVVVTSVAQRPGVRRRARVRAGGGESAHRHRLRPDRLRLRRLGDGLPDRRRPHPRRPRDVPPPLRQRRPGRRTAEPGRTG